MCQKRLPRGAACAVGGGGWIPYSESNPCEAGLVCVGGGRDAAGNALTGACAPVSDEGSPCVPQQGGEVVTGCKLGLACEEGRCAIPPSSGPCAEARMEGFFGQNSCGPGSYCDFSSNPPACIPTLPDGAACTCPYWSCEGGICLGANCIDPMSPADTHGTCASAVCHER